MILEGERVRLRPMVASDAPALARWAADPEFARNQWGRMRPPGEDAAREFIAFFQPPRATLYVIEHEGRAVGFVNYRDLNEGDKRCEVGIGIGERDRWSRGLGRDALATLVRHLVGDRGLHRINLHVISPNDRAVAAYKAVGFEVEGIERAARRADDGEWHDLIEMGFVVGWERPAFDPRPVPLVGSHVRLEPLRPEHAEELWRAADDDDVWRFLSWPRPRSGADVGILIRSALDEQVLGRHLPWLTRRISDGLAVGSTRFLNIDRANRSVEIGWTFLSREGRRTAANTEAKYLQLRHGFETLGALRIWLQTDERNQRSRAAIERIGARFEGIRRRDRALHDGEIRSSAVYAFTDQDWPAAKVHLERLMVGVVS